MWKKILNATLLIFIMLIIAVRAFLSEYSLLWVPFEHATPIALQRAKECEPIRTEALSLFEKLHRFTPGMTNTAISLAFRNDHHIVAVYPTRAVQPGTVTIWKLTNTEPIDTYEIAWVHPILTHLAEHGNVLVTIDDRKDVVADRVKQADSLYDRYTNSIIDVWVIDQKQMKASYGTTAVSPVAALSPQGDLVLWGGSESSNISIRSTDPEVRVDLNAGMWVPAPASYMSGEFDTATHLVFDHAGLTYAWLRKSTTDANNLIGIKDFTNEAAFDEFIGAGWRTRKEAVFDFDFDYSRQWLAVVRAESIVIHDLYSRFNLGKVQTQFPLTKQGKIRFSPTNEILAVATEHGVTLFERKNLVNLRKVSDTFASALAFSTDGCYLAFSEPDGHIQVWGIKNR